jgi:hypothetical protein
MPDKNLKYQSVTLLVPYREGVAPGDWDWWALADTAEPTWVSSSDDLTAEEARQLLTTNGFAEDENDLAHQVADEEEE